MYIYNIKETCAVDDMFFCILPDISGLQASMAQSFAPLDFGVDIVKAVLALPVLGKRSQKPH